MRGLKLHPWLQGFPALVAPEVHDICALCGEHGKPILVHDGTPNVSMPSQVGLLAARHSETRFILGHGGLMHLWREAAEVAATLPNVYITLCGPHPAALKHIYRTVPVERILWGTDHGISFVNMVSYRRRLIDLLGLDVKERRAILGENVATLLGWRPQSRSPEP